MPLTTFTWYSFIAITDNYYLFIFTKDSLNYLKLGIGCSRYNFAGQMKTQDGMQ